MNTVICPHCKKQVELSEAILHEFQDKIRLEVKKNLSVEFEKKQAEETELNNKKIRQQFEEENKNKKLELKETKEQNKKLIEQIEAMNQTLKDLNENQRKREYELRENLEKELSDKTRLEKLEYEKKINDMQKALEEAQRKGKQGSQQLQGDVLELDLEQRLREAFPYDEFRPVPTGVKGGDIIQEMRNKFGDSAGFILWETKRTKTWDKKWLTKLKDDMRNVKANDCILVSDVLPNNIKHYDRVENVWVASYEFAIKLAAVVRHGLLNVAIVRSSASRDDSELRELYNVITSDSFRQMFESRDETINALRTELDADKRGAEKRWKRQGAYIDKLDRNNSQLYGELQAHIPSLKPLQSDNIELSSGVAADDDDQESLF